MRINIHHHIHKGATYKLVIYSQIFSTFVSFYEHNYHKTRKLKSLRHGVRMPITVAIDQFSHPILATAKREWQSYH
ncbi:hypothetical protein TanjilG_10818 [Lupinus angustifolius]|uniref:Uncharacterized protein n=1 Tax=Lupinus angustifolius TaxID=3871 RepID=A0A1J7GLT2_LUPAN|nr:hypothetical protein TanjilG_10818 [Lupinus angustifolius]